MSSLVEQDYHKLKPKLKFSSLMLLNRLTTMKFVAALALLLVTVVAFAVTANGQTKEDLAEDFCPCPRNFNAVCGDDLVTYPNVCEFNCAQAKYSRQGRSIAIAHFGRC